MSPHFRRIEFPLLAIVLAGPALVAGNAPAARLAAARSETFVRSDGGRVPGKLSVLAGAVVMFLPEGGVTPIPMEPGAVVAFEGPGPDPSSGFPPFQIHLGLGQRMSGRLGSVTESTIHLADGPGGLPIALPRGSAHSLLQRAGEAQVFRDGFEAIESMRWARIGEPKIADEPRTEGEHSLRIPAGGASMTCVLPEPVGSGRMEVAYHDNLVVAPDQLRIVELMFRGHAGPELIRVVLGWSEESLAVETPRGGPALAVQHLARREGWHRLGVRFGPDTTEIAVDGDELAHGKGPGGPLVEIRLASYPTGKTKPPPDLAGHLDDLNLVRLTEPTGGLEIDATQDEVRLVGGDQVFGTIRAADANRVVLKVDREEASISWSEVSGLHFRRVPSQGRPIEGLLVRLEWQSAPGDDVRDLDQAEGALTGLTDASATLATPFAGDLTIPRDRIRRLHVLGRGRRIVLDATSHHLGDEISIRAPILDPPSPEGGVLERTFKLDHLPAGQSHLSLDVVQVVGEESSLPFSDLVRKGELRTNVQINGKFVDYLNRHINSKNEAPERIRLAVPAGLLREGENRLRIEQVAPSGIPNPLDDLGVLGIALESDSVPASPPLLKEP